MFEPHTPGCGDSHTASYEFLQVLHFRLEELVNSTVIDDREQHATFESSDRRNALPQALSHSGAS